MNRMVMIRAHDESKEERIEWINQIESGRDQEQL